MLNFQSEKEEELWKTVIAAQFSHSIVGISMDTIPTQQRIMWAADWTVLCFRQRQPVQQFPEVSQE